MACKTEQDAREIHQSGVTFYDKEKCLWYYDLGESKKFIHEDNRRQNNWVNGKDINLLEVKFLGLADKNIEQGVIISSFNAV